MKILARGLAVLTVVLALATGCHNPVLDPFRPDPTPLQIFTPKPEPEKYYPEGRATYQFLPDGKTTQRVIIETLRLADEDAMVFLEIDQLDDAQIIDELRRTAGRQATVWVALDDFTPEARTTLKPLADSLAGAGVTVILPSQISPALPFSRMQARSLFATQRDDSSVVIAIGGPLTAEGLASNCPSVLDLDSVDTLATLYSRLAQYESQAAPPQKSPRVIDGPTFTRNHLLSAIASAKTSLHLAAPTLVDPAVESALAAAITRKVAVRLLLGNAAEVARLKDAAVGEIRHVATGLPTMLVIDGATAILGSTPLDTAALDAARTCSLAITDAHLAAAANNWFEGQWEPKP